MKAPLMNPTRILILSLLACGLSAQAAPAAVPYAGWQKSGFFHILTTPEGANLPASAAEKDFPLLVRLTKEWFDFSQAKADGADIRFLSAAGAPLAYEIQEWDATHGSASIWVRIPTIQGNANQMVRMFWGNPAASSESNGKAVFNESNGYCAVLHLNGDIQDSTGSIKPANHGAKPTTGVTGRQAMNLVPKSDIAAADITNFPAGKNPGFSGEIWFRPRSLEGGWTMPLAWGTKKAWGWNTWLVQIGFWGSPQILPSSLVCRAPAQVTGVTPTRAGQWTHAVYTFSNTNNTSTLYVNGAFDAKTTNGAVDITNPQELGLVANGGDIDVQEARISSVARSADWIRMSYENQKPLQTLVGPLVQAGSEFSASAKQLTIPEGRSATIAVKAGGAQKIYWFLKRDGAANLVAVDRYAYTLDAGRVVGNQAAMLRIKAIYPNGAKTLDIPVTLSEDIPEPVFTLKAPATWDGRQTIEITPQISNLPAMQAKGAGELKYVWNISGLAVSKKVEPGKLTLTRAQKSGPLTVTLAISNGGQAITKGARIAVTEPAKDAWVQRVPAEDEQPVDNQFYARDDTGEGTLYYNGTLEEAAASVFLKLYADDKLVHTETQKVSANKRYALAVKLKPGLIKYKVEFGTKGGSEEKLLRTVSNLVCGDAYLIDGQSNALATDTHEEAEPLTHDWILSYGQPSPNNPQQNEGNLWCHPVWKARKGEKAELGWWGMDLARRLVERQKVPVCFINAAVGGTRIDQHQRSDANPEDLNTIYGRMLWRLHQAKLTHGIRAVIWHQGENNQGTAAGSGDYDWKDYQEYFLQMSAAWKEDMPNIRHYYVFQIWPNSCSMGGGGRGDMIREKQRTLPFLFAHMDAMSTLGIKPPGGCHYPLAGWSEFARLLQPMIERDIYGKLPSGPISAPNLKRASYTSPAKDAITLEFDQPVTWDDKLANEFYLDGEKNQIASGTTSGNLLTLKLKEPSKAATIKYLDETNWSQDRLLYGANGIAALTFCDVPVGSNSK